MSLDKYASLYEKMLEKPENRVRTYIKQPMPGDGTFDAQAQGAAVAPAIPKPAVVDDEDDWIKEVDQRVSAKLNGLKQHIQGTTPPIVNEGAAQHHLELAENRIIKLEKEVNELKELMTIMMKEHMKIIGKKNG